MPIEPFRPEYQRVADDLREQIRSGQLVPGAKLPTKRELVAQYGVGETSIDSAMLLLRTEGWVRGHQGRGVFVAEQPPEDNGGANTDPKPAGDD
jgi:GntR family transcriptional regulator